MSFSGWFGGHRPPLRGGSDERGNSLMIVMLTIAVLAVVAGNLMWSASARYHVTYQSASWQEALVGAEAGVDFAMGELRKRVVLGPGGAFQIAASGSNLGWTKRPPGAAADYPDLGQAFPADGRAYTVGTHAGEGNATLRARVYVDVPGSDGATNFAQTPPASIDPFMCEQSDKSGTDAQGHYWYRVRALGIAGVSGPPRPSPDARDNWLRRFSFATDWRTARPVDAGGPQVSRLVEVVAKPQTNYRNALMADAQHGNKDFAINLNGLDVLIDSYDSNSGPYDSATNHGQLGNLATNGKVINAGLATVMGDAMTNQGTTINDGNVTGQHRDDFYQELTPITPADMRADWAGVANKGTITAATAFTASTDRRNPTRIHVNGIDLTGTKILNLNAPAPAAGALPTDPVPPSYIKVYVEGGIRVANDGSAIIVADGVNAIIYFTGDVNLSGLGIINDSFVASHLLLQGLQPPADANGDRPLRSINLSTSEDFEGILYAPNHDLTLALQAAGPTTGSGSSGTATSTPPDPRQQKAIKDLQEKIRKLNEEIINKQRDADNAYTNYTSNPSPSAWRNYQDKQAEVAKKTNERDTQQAKLDKLTKDSQSQAEDHARGYNGIYGAFVARTIDVQSKTHLHYDEALREAGPVNHYEIVNWFEDNTSRATVNW